MGLGEVKKPDSLLVQPEPIYHSNFMIVRTVLTHSMAMDILAKLFFNLKYGC